jgi:putative two-component system response regulator
MFKGLYMTLQDMKIVSIDDNKNNLLLVDAYCSELGLSVKSFENPVEAMMHVLRERVDLIIIDYMMPELNGVEFVKEFRSGHPDVPVIMVTAVADDDDLHQEALEAGVNDFLSKPLNQIHFKLRVENLLKLHKSNLLLSDRAKLLEEEVNQAVKQINEREFETLDTLGRTAEYKDPETGAHVARVAHYAKMLAKEYGLDEDIQTTIFHASPFHDIGKVGIPDRVLLKPGRLDEDEFEIMKTHSIIGYDILKNATSKYLVAGGRIALTHHEKYDGTGYPKGLVAQDIPIEGRIVAVADVFDALTSKRPYKEPWSFERAIGLLQEESGKHFDPKIVDIFIKNIEQVKEIHDRYQEEEINI